MPKEPIVPIAEIGAAFDHQTFLANVTQSCGIYQMFSADKSLLYVGKAKNLRQRLSSYFRATGLNTKTMALVSKINSIEVTVTNTEVEALLLEHNLIKSHRPPYNILLKDDKSYPYIYLSTDQTYPRLSFHRGAKSGKGKYFGPYPNSSAVRDSLNFLQKTFKIRQCEDSYFKNRSRPCLQYQIKRCTGPCVGFISPDQYSEDVSHAQLFLEGRSQELVKLLGADMEAAAVALAFELAAKLRDQIQSLQQLQASQYVEGDYGNLDVVACAIEAGLACVQLLTIRDGRLLGSRSYFPKLQLEETEAEVLSVFVTQHYLSQAQDGLTLPKEVILSHALNDDFSLDAFKSITGSTLNFISRVRSQRAQWQTLAIRTAQQNLSNRLMEAAGHLARLESLKTALELETLPQRMECFDISHTSGEETVASCVVFDANGPLKKDYRRYKIEGITGGDDYAAMYQALSRRYARVKRGEVPLPDILFIDGGVGQVSMAKSALNELQIVDILIIGVSKGPDRKEGQEILIRGDDDRAFHLPAHSPALHLIQHIRNESHRFAITSHRNKRDKKRVESPLEGIPGIGPKRRRELLKFFGGIQAIKNASVEDLIRAPGISIKIAEDIYSSFHHSES